MTIFNVPDMSCGHCKASVEKAVAATDPAARVAVDLPTRQVTIDSILSDADLQAALLAAGYPATARP